MEELEIKYLLITRISTYIVENFYGSLEKPEENEKKQMYLYAGTKLARCRLHPLLYRLFSRNNANISKAEWRDEGQMLRAMLPWRLIFI